MSRRSHIRAVGQKAAKETLELSEEIATEEPLEVTEEWVDEEYSEQGEKIAWVVPAIAILAILGWTGFYGWTFQTEILQGGTPAQWINWITQWSIPTLLITTTWLLAMRNSRREAKRFTDTAALLSRESADLEARLTIVNRELSLAREFLGAQSRELESFGRIASERLSNHATQLDSLIHDNGEQIDSIAAVSDTAMTNMTKLRDDLPVIANSARDVSNQVGNAGRTAHEQLDKLIAGFDRLNHFGLASERQVASLSGKVDSTIKTFEEQLAALDSLTDQRFEHLKEKSEEYRAELDSREVEALAAMRHRADELRNGVQSLREAFASDEDECLAALNSRILTLRDEGASLASSLREGEQSAIEDMRQSKDRLYEEIAEVVAKLNELDAQAVAAAQKRIKALFEEANRFDELMSVRDGHFTEEVRNRQAKFEAREAEASELLSKRMEELDAALEERSLVQIERADNLARHGEEIAAKVNELNGLFAAVSDQAAASREQLDTGIGEFSKNIAVNQEQLRETETAISGLTDSSVRLLEIIQSGAQQSREELPRSMQAAIDSISTVEERAIALTAKLDEAGKRSEDLSSYVIAARDDLETAGNSVESIFARLATQTGGSIEDIEKLRVLLQQAEEQSANLSKSAQQELTSAIEQLDEATRSVLSNLKSSTSEELSSVAESVGTKAAEAIDRSLLASSKQAIAELEEAASKAGNSGKDAVAHLRDQLSKVNELIRNLEQRVERARDLAEERVDNDFARRMALITEALNSNAIDVTRILSSDVSDTAWTAYLKGDRGIFSRRAVRLLENAQARRIASQYQEDDEFREHVNRYVHDFESMLRSLLSTRDGNVLGVTVLSSDVGKLYVALAQAIERLRN